MAKILKIITKENPILRKKSLFIDKKKISSTELQDLCLNMSETMDNKNGVGLAAPQIGKNIRLIVINTKDGHLHLFNPEIIKTSWKKELGDEGCLSVPDIFGKVKRFTNINCQFFDKKGKIQKLKANGLMARVIQHEIDHLDGILFIDKAKDIQEIKEM